MVHPVRRRDDHGIHVVAREQCLPVSVGGGGVVGGQRTSALRVLVARRDEPAADAGERRRAQLADVATPDQSVTQAGFRPALLAVTRTHSSDCSIPEFGGSRQPRWSAGSSS